MSTMAFIDSMFSNQNQNNALINYLLQQQNAQSTLGSPGMNALLGTSLAESGSDVLLKLLATTNVSAPDYLNSMSLTSQSMLHPQTTLTMPSYLGVNPGGLFSPAAVCNALLFPHRSKRIRTAFTPAQLNKLEIQFNKSPYVVGNQRRQISEELGLTETQVKVWFQNRRTKEKRGVNPGDQDDPVSSEEETDNAQETEHARKFCGSTDGGPDCISKLINSSKPDLKPENCEISRKVSINSSHLPCKKNRSEDKDKHNPVKHFKKLASQGTS